MSQLDHKTNPVMPAKAGIRQTCINLGRWIAGRIPAYAGMTIVLLTIFSFTARAEEFVYSPEGCEFKMAFPGEPHVIRRCHNKMTDKCTTMTGYTQVFGLDATVNFYVSCLPSQPEFRKAFTPDLMRTSLLARPYVDTLEVYDINQDETPEALMGALLGAGPSPNGNDQMVYVTQIWVGDKSVLTVEGELIGAQMEESDKLFADILRSLQAKKPEEPASDAIPAPEKEAETPAQDEKPAPAEQEKDKPE